MNMTLSKRGDYVMRSAIALARAYESGSPRKIREVVADTEMPRTFASQILADLVRAGLAVSRAGRDGGYRLARTPAQISVLEVIEAAEGPLRAERCALGEGPCRWDAVCPLHETWSTATGRLAGLLTSTSLADVAARDAAIEAGAYDVPADAHRSHALSVQLADGVQVEVPARAFRSALAGRTQRLSSFVGAAARDAAAPVETAGRPAALMAECSLDAVGSGGSVDEPDRYLLAWRLSDAGGTSHFEGELSAVVVDADRTELQVTGTWHRDLAGAPPPTTEELRRQSRSVLRGFLRRLARTVEEEPFAVPARRPGPARRAGAGA